MKKIPILPIIFIMLVIAVIYFLLLQFYIRQYGILKKGNQSAIVLLKQKENLNQENRKTIRALAAWEKNHPRFYEAINSNETGDQLMQQLTSLAQQAHFSLLQASPVSIDKNQNESIQIKLSGNYTDLFYFINEINSLSYPISLLQLKIPKRGIVECVFGI